MKRKTNKDIDEELLAKAIPFTRIEDYAGANSSILFKCNFCNTESKRRPAHLLVNVHKCVVCFNKSRTKTNEQYDQQLINKNILDIKRIGKYINNYTPIKFTCNNKHIWLAQPAHILNNTQCPACLNNSKRSCNEEYDQKLLDLNVDLYRVGTYINNYTSILHECINGHSWEARPSNILSGRKCPSCSKYGFDNNKQATIYYVHIIENINIQYFKIGITNNSIEKRFEHDRDKKITILWQKDFEIGKEAHELEKFILSNSPIKPVTVPGFLKGGGNTELFKEDILLWITMNIETRFH